MNFKDLVCLTYEVLWEQYATCAAEKILILVNKLLENRVLMKTTSFHFVEAPGP
jgi:hypothetical protein